MTIDSTVKRIEPPATIEILAGGGLAAVIFFSVGVFMTVVPVIGWIIGPALMITAGLIAILHIGEIFGKKAEYVGHCPSCGAQASAGEPESVHICAACKKQYVYREDKLVAYEPGENR